MLEEEAVGNSTSVPSYNRLNRQQEESEKITYGVTGDEEDLEIEEDDYYSGDEEEKISSALPKRQQNIGKLSTGKDEAAENLVIFESSEDNNEGEEEEDMTLKMGLKPLKAGKKSSAPGGNEQRKQSTSNTRSSRTAGKR